MELSPETCRVKPLRRINAIVASCWIYFTIQLDTSTISGVRAGLSCLISYTITGCFMHIVCSVDKNELGKKGVKRSGRDFSYFKSVIICVMFHL